VTDSAKSGGGLTTSVTEVVREGGLVLVPVIVTAELPSTVLVVVDTVIVVEPEVVIDAGLKLALAPLGNPPALKVTVPVNPPEGVTVTV